MKVSSGQRGQAMVEYSSISAMLLLMLVVTFTVQFPLPFGGSETKQLNLMDAFLQALQAYFDSYYFLLNFPFP